MSAEGHLSPEQFGLASYKLGLMPAYDATGNTGFQPDLPRKRIKVAGIRASQADISPERVDQYVKGGKIPYRAEHPPHVFHHDGDTMVLDGHHRIAAAIKKGQKTITVRWQEG